MEGALVSHEVLHSINSSQSPNFVVKLDMMKAYEKVCWTFIFQVLQKMSFLKTWCKWIKACTSRASLLVIINGKASDLFSSTQGVRQGDPLSPTLFIIMVEAFSKTIKLHNSLGKWKGVHIHGTSLFITHSLFANDTLFFGNSHASEAKQINHILQLYSNVSGQKINSQK